jgi:hypothetical protein
MDKLTIEYVWRQQKEIPVILRRTGKGKMLRVRLPYYTDNRSWLQNDRRAIPAWSTKNKYWEIPKAWFDDFVNRALAKYGMLYVVQPYREQEICAHQCRNATGHECQCSCMGQYHGQGDDGSWFDVTDTFSTRWGQRMVACRLMTARSDS